MKKEENEEYYKIIVDDIEIGFMGLKIYDSSIYLYRFYIEEKHYGRGFGTVALEKLIQKVKTKIHY